MATLFQEKKFYLSITLTIGVIIGWYTSQSEYFNPTTGNSNIASIPVNITEPTHLISANKTLQDEGQANNSKDTIGDLTHHDANKRLSALLDIWKLELTTTYKDKIENLIQSESNAKVKQLATWISEKEVTQLKSHAASLDTASSNLDSNTDPDKKILMSLSDNIFSTAQDNETLTTDNDLVEPIFSLQPEDQLKYIEELVVSNEDAAIEALGSLILHEDETIQKAAIDGLLTIMNHQTGHFKIVTEVLEYNSAFLNASQLTKVQEAIFKTSSNDS